MPRIEPFRGILYNNEKVDISKVVAPPYDVIPLKMQDELYRLDAHNAVRLILGKEEAGDSKDYNKYKRAREFFDKWLSENILIEDKTPSIYVYSEEYSAGGAKKIQLGFIAAMKIEESSKVRPHENTFPKPKQDRLSLIREVNANLSCIFTLFDDKNKKAEKILGAVISQRPLFNFEYDNVRHKLWRLGGRPQIDKLKKLMLKKEIFIADGHHRYEVARMYKEETGNEYVMTYFTPVSGKRLTILATHRLVKNIYTDIGDFIGKLRRYFNVEKIKSLDQLLKKMSAAKTSEYIFGVYFKDKVFYLLRLKPQAAPNKLIKEKRSRAWKGLDVSVLHGVIFNRILGLNDRVKDEDNIVYTRDPKEARKEVDKGGFDAAFFLNPTKVAQVRDIARIGDKMPHKSTYFYPKLLSGLVINKLA